MEFDPQILHQLCDIGIALSKEQHMPTLQEMILKKARELTHADGGTFYTVSGKKTLRFEIVLSESLGFHLGGTSEQPIPFADLPLFDPDGTPNESLMVAYAVHHKRAITIDDAYAAEGFDFSGTQRFDTHTGYRTQAVLTVPLFSYEGDVIAVLQLINPQTHEKRFTSEDVELATSLASQAGVALNNQLLIHNLRELFHALMRVIVEAIDEKSPSTGNHGKRVPEIACALAQAEGSFSEEELYELYVAALLHDCGKITTPVYLEEKKTKLEGIFDRIEAIEARCAAAGVSHDDFAFLARCNRGEETIDPAAKQRIEELAKRTWKGDKPLLTDNEVKALLIEKGNLTPKERKIMENHVVMTKRMLSQLPFPKHLKRVPEIASNHHERIDGKGYPRGLRGEQMSTQAKILAIADVFEALSSPDRSYRKPAPLSEVLSIMQQMVDEGHLDPDLFALFVKKKAYLEYAARYLMPEQLNVD